MPKQFSIWRVLTTVYLIAIIVFVVSIIVSVVLEWQSGVSDLRGIVPPYVIGGQPSEYTISNFCRLLGSLGLLPLLLLPLHVALLLRWMQRPVHLCRVVATAIMPFLYLIYGAVFFLVGCSTLTDDYLSMDMKDMTMLVARLGELSVSLWVACLASFLSLSATIVLLSRSKPISANQAIEGTAR